MQQPVTHRARDVEFVCLGAHSNENVFRGQLAHSAIGEGDCNGVRVQDFAIPLCECSDDGSCGYPMVCARDMGAHMGVGSRHPTDVFAARVFQQVGVDLVEALDFLIL